jgi:hypothetical protein
MNKMKPGESILSFMHALFQNYVNAGHHPKKAKALAYEDMIQCFLAFIKQDTEIISKNASLLSVFLSKMLNEIGKSYAKDLAEQIKKQNVSEIEKIKTDMKIVKETKDHLLLFASKHKNKN